MGLFGGIARNLFGPSLGYGTPGIGDDIERRKRGEFEGQPTVSDAPGKKGGFNWGNAALGFFGGPDVARMIQQKQMVEQKDAKEQAMLGSVRQSLLAEGMPEHVVNGFMANPDNVSAYFLEKMKTRQFGPEGGSVMRGGSENPSWLTAPRIDSDGNQFAPGNGVDVNRPVHEGIKYPTAPIGMDIKPVGAFTGRDLTAGAPQLPRPRTEAEVNALPPGAEFIAPDGSRKRKGGAAPAMGPAGFPRPY